MKEQNECISLELFLFKYDLTPNLFHALKLMYDMGKKVSGKVKLLHGEFRLFPDQVVENIINRSDCELAGRTVETFSDVNKIRLVVTYPSGKKVIGKETYVAGDSAIEQKINELYKILRHGIKN